MIKAFVITGRGAELVTSPFRTSQPACSQWGDVRAGSVKRVASSVGEGSVVISKVWEFVNRLTSPYPPLSRRICR